MSWGNNKNIEHNYNIDTISPFVPLNSWEGVKNVQDF